MKLDQLAKLVISVFSMLTINNVCLAQTPAQLNLITRIPEAADVVSNGINNKLSSKEIGEKLNIIERNGTAKSHDWVRDDSSGYDKNIYFNKNKITSWYYYNIPDEIRKANSAFAEAGSAKQLIEIDCRQHKFRVIASLIYREHMVKGSPIEPIEYIEAPTSQKIKGGWFVNVAKLCKTR